jgi:hypothetical protein
VIEGVPSLVMWDVDVNEGEVVEAELAFFAQDDAGNVWNLGEYPEEYEDGTLTGAPSTWISGTARARAGQAMLAHPRVGTPTYLQGFSPSIDFKDCATVFQTNQHVCVTLNCYDGVLVVDEFAPLDPEGGHQRKFHAPGVGVIKVGAAGGVDPEVLQLTKAAPLCENEFNKVRRQVLAQDARGYRVARDVYSSTTRARQTLDAHLC